jgi:O-antigen/teichoic acid export membrane protein
VVASRAGIDVNFNGRLGEVLVGPIVGQWVLAFVYRCIGAAVSFLFGIIFARTMAIEEYGVLMSSLTLAFIAGTVAVMGQQTQLLREMPNLVAQANYAAIRYAASRRLKLACVASITVTFAAAVAFIIAHGRVAMFSRWEYMAWLLLILPLAIVEMQSAAGRALGSMHLALAPKEVLWRVLITAFGLAYVLTTSRQLRACDVFVMAVVVLTLLIIAQQAWLRRLMGSPLLSLSAFLGKSSPSLTLRAAAPFWATSVANALFPTVDVVVVSTLVGPEAGAYYYAANRIALLLEFFMAAFSMPAATYIARWYDAGLRNEITHLASSGALLAFVSVFAAFTVLIVAGDLVLTAFGSTFVRSYDVMLLLGSGALVSAYLGVGTPALDMTGHQAAAMRIMVTTSCASLIVMIGATLAFGVWGAAATATVTPLVMKAAMAVHLYRAEAIDITASSKIRELLARVGAAPHVLSPTVRPLQLSGSTTPSAPGHASTLRGRCGFFTERNTRHCG